MAIVSLSDNLGGGHAFFIYLWNSHMAYFLAIHMKLIVASINWICNYQYWEYSLQEKSGRFNVKICVIQPLLVRNNTCCFGFFSLSGRLIDSFSRKTLYFWIISQIYPDLRSKKYRVLSRETLCKGLFLFFRFSS